MPLGDSITKGIYDGSTPPTAETVGYRQKLYLDLTDASYDVDFVGGLEAGWEATPPFDDDHEGHPGYTDDEVADEVNQWLQANPPDIILLHIGTNYLKDPDPSDVEEILEEIDTFSTEITVVLARIINRKNHHQITTDFNENIQAMADARIAVGDKIVVVDQESALDYPEDMYDLLHPNQTGYNKMADVWYEALVPLIESECLGAGPTPTAEPTTVPPTATAESTPTLPGATVTPGETPPATATPASTTVPLDPALYIPVVIRAP
jgi:lysophospholipase L1-like esterase